MQQSDMNALLGKAEQCRTLLEQADNLLEEMSQLRADLQGRFDRIMEEVSHVEPKPYVVAPVSKRRTVNGGLSMFLYRTLKEHGPLHLNDLLEQSVRAGFTFRKRDKKSQMATSMSRDKARFKSDGAGTWSIIEESDGVDLKNGAREESAMGTAIRQLRAREFEHQ